MANVHTAALTALGDGQSAGPSKRLEDVDSECDISIFATSWIGVLLSVTNDFADPAGLLTWELCVLTQVSEPLNSGVLSFELLHGGTELLLGQVQWLVGYTASLKNDLVHVTPDLDVSQLFCLREGKLFAKLDFIGLFIKSEKALGHDRGSVEDSSECRSEQVPLFATESRVRVDDSVQVT